MSYGNLTLEDLVNKDIDSDGILDWEEGLYGLDPTKKETTPGTPDISAIQKLKADNSSIALTPNEEKEKEENLTQTEKFSRELFATVAAASQNGALDPATIEQLGASLAERIQNSPPRKVFLTSEIQIKNDDSVPAFRAYNNSLISIYKKYPAADYTILEVLEKFMIDENTVDTSMLLKLDPIITQTNSVKSSLIKISVPQSITNLHLNVINALERLAENLTDIKLFDNDIIVALGGISKYQENAVKLESDLNNLANAINQKLKN